MFALFSVDDLRAEAQGQLTLGMLETGVAPGAPVGEPVTPKLVMPRPWELILREEITGQGVLGA